MADAINVRITAMREIAGDVDMLAINARLMSVGMGEAGDDFLGFAAEIRRSAKLAQNTLEQIGREARMLSQMQEDDARKTRR